MISAGIAHVLAWFASLFMAFGPVYQGVSSTVETRPGGFAIESVETSETLLEANGLSMLPLLVGPVVLTALVVAILMTTPSSRRSARCRCGWQRCCSLGSAWWERLP